MTTFSKDVEIYTPDDKSYNPAWAPQISSAPLIVKQGSHSNRIDGVLFNGMSQACSFGDDYQCATNYPLVRMTNLLTHHVMYSRTHDHSFMGVAAKNKPVHTFFDVPEKQEIGLNILEVVANGIPSQPTLVLVLPSDHDH